MILYFSICAWILVDYILLFHFELLGWEQESPQNWSLYPAVLPAVHLFCDSVCVCLCVCMNMYILEKMGGVVFEWQSLNAFQRI